MLTSCSKKKNVEVAKHKHPFPSLTCVGQACGFIIMKRQKSRIRMISEPQENFDEICLPPQHEDVLNSKSRR